ncbi:MAG TPA: GTP-binding protein [Cellvibrio sp.]|nr:GTP-binding protein [Cellvibrio sp.]
MAHKNQQPSLSPAWQVSGLEIPESVIEVKRDGKSYFLVSLIKGDFFSKDGNGDIAKISASGKLLDSQWASGLNAPKGMAVSGNFLYVSDIDEVAVIDLKTGAIVDVIPVPGAAFLNDVAANRRGDIFVSDTGAGKIFRIRNFVPEVYIDNVASANGLFVDKDKLIVGSGTQLVRYNAALETTVITQLPFGIIDGIAKVKRDNYLASLWEGQIYWINRDGSQTLLLDLTTQGIYTADFAYSNEKKLLVVPTFFSNTVTAYRLQY